MRAPLEQGLNWAHLRASANDDHRGVSQVKPVGVVDDLAHRFSKGRLGDAASNPVVAATAQFIVTGVLFRDRGLLSPGGANRYPSRTSFAGS